MNVVFLGGGRITGALVAGLRRTGFDGRIVVHDRHPKKLRRLHRQWDVEIENNLRRAVNRAGILIVAVRPPQVRALLEAIGPLARPAIAVSLAAGVRLRQLRTLGPGAQWARAMPSPASRTAHGLTALAFDRGASKKTRQIVRRFFSRVGAVLEIPERQFDAFTAVYSTSHGYHALAALIQAARKIGLDRKTATVAATHGLADALASRRARGASLEELLAEAATPGGIAATVMDTLSAGGYHKLLERALRTGLARARAAARR
jgi:pyrroline-5-carboxylate reductase